MQNWRYHGFSASAITGSCTISSTRARICSILSKSASSIVAARPSGLVSLSPLRMRISRLPMMSVQPSPTRSSGSGMPLTRLLKLSIRRFCQPGCSDAAHSASVGRSLRTSMLLGVRWNT